MMSSVLFVFGTRPEAIKLAPVIREIRRHADVKARICVTGQHRALLDQVLQVFSLQPDYDLQVMQPGQTLAQVTATVLLGLQSVLAEARPGMVIVQGDTTTTFCGALAAFYAGIPVAHVEAGLRTHDFSQPFPEEMNRVLVSKIASLHFAATRKAAGHLYAEGVPAANVHVTGNSGIDALLFVREQLAGGSLPQPEWTFLDPSKRLIVVTVHRRESFGPAMESIGSAIREIACLPDVQVALPVHPNPNVSVPMREILSGLPNVALLEPLDYVSFVSLMSRAFLLVTDSGGVQEEAPSLRKPVIVMREKTERPEGVAAGASILAGTHSAGIVEAVRRLMTDKAEYERRAGVENPYGDGKSSQRMCAAVLQALRKQAGSAAAE